MYCLCVAALSMLAPSSRSLAPSVAAAASSRPASPPSTLIAAALDAMGNDRLREARSLRIVGVEHEYLIGNAERAEGPWRVSYDRFTELRDPIGHRLRRTDIRLSAGARQGTRVTIVDDSVAAYRDGDKETGASPQVVENALDRMDGSPEQALTLAAASPALRLDGTVVRWGITHDIVSFPWRNGRMRIELSRETHLPTAIEIIRAYPDDFRRAPFGDITVRTDYADWLLDPSGVCWPRQHIVSINGQPLRNAMIDSVILDRAPAPADSFAVGDSARAGYASNARQSVRVFQFGTNGPPTEIRPGIVRVPDLWSMTLVRQDDGVVIFEAHLSASYLHQVMDEAQRRFPGLPVKAIVMTSDPWAHVGGVREAMALGIPIYVSARSVPFLTALARAPHRLEPDALERTHRAPRFIPVSTRTVVGTGANRIELYPVGGPYAERMTMAYFPEHRLLYGADLVFKVGERGYDRTPAVDLRRAVARERLAVDTVFCVQRRQPPVPWSQFVPEDAG